MDIEKMIMEIRQGRGDELMEKEVQEFRMMAGRNRASRIAKDDRIPYEVVEFEDTPFRLGTWYYAVDVSKKDDFDWFTRVKPIEVKGRIGRNKNYVTVMCMVQDSTMDSDWRYRADYPYPFYVVRGHDGAYILYHRNMDGNEILATDAEF